MVGRETHVTLRNVTESAQRVVPHFAEVGTDTPKHADLPALMIPPATSLELPVQDALLNLREQGVSRASLYIESDAPKGALIGSTTQIVQEGLLEDIPLRASNPQRFMRGAYPLRWENDYTNRPMIVNTSAEPLDVRAYVISGGTTYTFPIKTVQAGATLDYDIDTIRQQGTPDINGKKVPQTATFGKFHWSPVAGTKNPGLIGRTELLSLSTNRASSFSCGFECAYEYDSFPLFGDDPFGDYYTPSTSAARTTSATEYVQDSYGNTTGDYAITYGRYAPVSVADTSILSMQGDYNAYNLVFSTGAPGSTNGAYHHYVVAGQQSEDGSYCNYPDYGSDQNPPVQVHPTVAITGGSTVPLAAQDTPGAVNTIQLTASPNPGGGTYSWSASNGNVSLFNSSSATVTLTSAAGGDVMLTVTYALNGESATATQNVKVQVPTGLTNVKTPSSFDCTAYGSSLTYNTESDYFLYTVADQSGISLNGFSMPAVEQFTNISNSCAGVPYPTPLTTSTNTIGQFTDTQRMCSSSCLPAGSNRNPTGSCGLKVAQRILVNGFQVQSKTLEYTCPGPSLY